MPIYTDVVASRIEKYRAQLARENGNDADINMAMFWIAIGGLVDAAFSGGGGGGGSTSASTIAQGINQSTDIDTIATRLASIDDNQLNQSAVRAAIDSAIDIDAILTRLISIDTNQINQSAIQNAIDASADISSILASLQSIDTKTIAQSDIIAAIQAAADIDTLIARLTSIESKTPLLGTALVASSTPVNIASDQIVNVRDRSTTAPIAQTTITLAANGTNQFVIPANARSLTICITSGSLVHYTEDGSVPTTANCWFAGGSKEIWDYAVPAGATLRLLAVSAATVSIQVRV